jgi:tyrosyl-tRNA synthetase
MAVDQLRRGTPLARIIARQHPRCRSAFDERAGKRLHRFRPHGGFLHVGNMVQIMILVHFQRCGHKPIALVGGATGMVGDPSGKKSERNLLDEDALRHNQRACKAQLERFLDFNSRTPQSGRAGEQLRLVQGHGLPALHPRSGQAHHGELHDGQGQREEPLGDRHFFTEFSYQLVQGYDFTGCTSTRIAACKWAAATSGATSPPAPN